MFDPNAVGKQYDWGTYIPERHPNWREHRRQSDARNAYNRATTATLYRWLSGAWVQVDAKQPAPPKPAPKPVPTLNFQSDRQRELMRVVLDRFAEFDKRNQTYYGLEGMSTSHLTLKAIGDFDTLHAFWPSENITIDPRMGNLYYLGDDTLTKVQSSIRTEVEKLATQGLLERLGNEHERRWRPAKYLKGVTL